MIGDQELPEGWQGSYGTLNTRRALADIHARLLALEAAQQTPTPIDNGALEKSRSSAVLFRRCADGHFECTHVFVIRQRVLGYFTALAAIQDGRNLVFVEPTAASALLDFLEADGKQAQR